MKYSNSVYIIKKIGDVIHCFHGFVKVDPMSGSFNDYNFILINFREHFLVFVEWILVAFSSHQVISCLLFKSQALVKIWHILKVLIYALNIDEPLQLVRFLVHIHL